MNVRIPRCARTAGFSLIELMVAMTLGLVVLGGVVMVMVNSKKNYTVQDSLARLQENARFAVQFISKDLRNAGYFGCADDITAVFNHVNGTAGSLFGDDGDDFVAKAIDGFEQGTTKWQVSGSYAISYIYAGTDAIMLRSAAGRDAVPITLPYMPNESAALHTAAGNGLKKGDIVVVTDCESADIFQITGPDDPSGGTINHNTGAAGVSPGNATQALSKTYEGEAFIMKVNAIRYYIGTGASGNPALFRETLVTGAAATIETAEELVDGIENLQILYGEDTDLNDRIPDVYVPTNIVKDWANVVSVRIVLLAYSIASATDTGEYGAGADSDTYNLDTSSDSYSGQTGNRKRKIFGFTVSLRNLR